jgi:2-dehydro-3-deoxyphosphogluconate aldolase / (4S)-4-hydroxy-2-oxoglutarate aldolase
MTGQPPQSMVHEVLNRVQLLPLVVLGDAAAAAPLGETLVQAGLPIMEIALRTGAALDAIRAAAKNPQLCLGAGTVLSANQVSAAAEAGAQFIVTPGLDPTVVRACLYRELPVIPGVATPSDMQAAFNAGLRTVKFFPAAYLGGPPAIRALGAAYQDMRFVPTGGITAATAAAYLAEPAVVAVGGSWMVPRAQIDHHDFAAIAELCRAAVTAARGRSAATSGVSTTRGPA